MIRTKVISYDLGDCWRVAPPTPHWLRAYGHPYTIILPPIRGSSSEDTLLSKLSAKITAVFRRARPERYYVETHLGDWLHHIESLCSSCGLTRGAWSSLAVIQLRGAARRWWESIGQDLNLVRWRDFRRNITEYFIGLFLYRKRMADLTYAPGRRFFTRTVIYAEMHPRAKRVDTPPTRRLENAEDASSHVEVPAHTNQKPWEMMMPALIQKRRTPPKFSLKEKMTRLMVHEY
ncbi:hypothetical protein TIFTF001_027177 [Ficus carica]|uniref:Retrotransposon gag domain-containing protein n=1 Tax=Ficus carica TaxID=3494 RepID=A0AA88DMI5_FICCA|nr:hypothetical protein TIFTF001_027177 [Ficus carica]